MAEDPDGVGRMVARSVPRGVVSAAIAGWSEANGPDGVGRMVPRSVLRGVVSSGLLLNGPDGVGRAVS